MAWHSFKQHHHVCEWTDSKLCIGTRVEKQILQLTISAFQESIKKNKVTASSGDVMEPAHTGSCMHDQLL